MTDSCSARSREEGEPIAGSAAPEVAVWVVLEHRGVWGPKAVADSELPDAVKQRLAGWQDGVPGARVQLARRSGRVEDAALRFWVGVSDLGRSRLVQWSLPSVDAVLELDLAAIVDALRRGETIEGTHEPREPLVLVCTNGRRDVCCSVRGIPVAKALEAEAGLDVWQTTHLKGHRFAATLLHLPPGLCYGRVEPDEAPALAQAIREGRIFRLDRLRGRTALAASGQAAEAIWREREGIDEVDALVHAEHVERDGQTVVTLRDRDGGTHEIRVEHRELGATAPPSCGKPPEPVTGWLGIP